METNSLSQLAQLGAGIAIGFGAIGLATKGLMDAVSRQPEVAGKAFGFFLLGAALSEACALYAFVIAFQLLGK